MPVRRSSAGGSQSAPTRVSRSSGPVRRTGGTTKKKEGKTWWDKYGPPDFLKDIMVASASPVGWALSRSDQPVARGAGRAALVLGTAPFAPIVAPKRTVGQSFEAVRGLFEAPFAIYGGVRDHGFYTTMDTLWEGIKADYKARYGADWRDEMRKNPLSNLFDALTVLGVGARGATLAGSAGRLLQAGKPLGGSKVPWRTNIWEEAAQPGSISEGAARMRQLRYQPETGPLLTAAQPFSRSPVRRGVQSLNDLLSSKAPNAPVFGAAARIARTQAKGLERDMNRVMGVPRHIEALDKLSDAGRTRLFFAAQLGRGANVTNETLRQFREVLAKGFANEDAAIEGVDPDFAQWLREAKQAGFGPKLLERIDDAIKYEPDDQYRRATEALQDMTEVSESVIADANGFTSLTNDIRRSEDRLSNLDPDSDAFMEESRRYAKLLEDEKKKKADLSAMFHSRRGRMRDWFDARRFADVPERAAWLDRLTQQLDPEQAASGIRFADRLANVSSDPAAYWRDRIGMPTDETAADFQARNAAALFQRAGTPGGGEQPLIEGRIEDLLGTSIFYSPLQKLVGELPAVMKVRTLEKRLMRDIPPEEFYNAGIDLFFRGREPHEMVATEELRNHLANRLNAYNLREVHRVNLPEAEGRGHGTKYDWEHQGNYISRDPRQGEYHEVTFELPGPGRDPAYVGKGYSHWQQGNVTVHFRFHVFSEDGKTKLLVEEIQSDWANEWRDAHFGKGLDWRELKPDELEHLDRLDYDADFGKQLLTDAYDELERARRAALTPDAGSAEDDALYDAEEALQRIREELRHLDQERQDFYDDNKLSRVPPSPVGTGMGARSSYVNAPVRWLTRYAAENGVDEIIVVDRHTQRVRNAKAIDPREWQGFKGGDAQEITRFLDEQGPPVGRSYIGYEDGIPKAFAREMGVEGERLTDAYDGQYRVPVDFEDQAAGRMPGTVFRMTDEAKRRAMKPRSLYQRTPDWNALPKGATELLADGRTRAHLFEQGDLSTWIHELGHIAVHDLDDADRVLLDQHYSGGKTIDSWSEMAHESFARDWETYVRKGEAPTPALKSLFSRLSEWMRAVVGKLDEEGDIPDEIAEVFGRMLQSENTPDIFIPHRAGAPNLSGGRTSKGIPRAGREIGDRALSRIPLFKQNTLALMRSGMLNPDPNLMIEHTNRIIMLARANQLREMVLEMADPLLPGEYPDFDTQYVIKRTGSGVDKPLYDALESAENPDEIREVMVSYIDRAIMENRAEMEREAALDGMKYEEWRGTQQLYVADKKFVDMLFKNVTGKTPGATTKAGVSTGGAVVDSLLDSLRGLLLYANPGFYASNMLGNSWMMLTSNPQGMKYMRWSMTNAMRAAKPEDTANPLWERISVEMGRGPTSGGLSYKPQFIGQGPNRSKRVVKRAAEGWSYRLGRWGRKSGRVIDDSFRVAAWRAAAAKRGYRTEAEVNKLLTDAGKQRRGLMDMDTKEKRDLNAIRDEAENLMLDFDSMTPFERTWLQRFVFLYPFIRASAKYPLMYAGERPVMAGVMGQAGLQGNLIAEQVLGERPELPAWASGYARGPGGYYNVGSISPFSMPADLAESLMGVGQATEIGVNRPYSFLNPGLQLVVSLLRSQNRYGRDAPAPEILRSDFPAPAYLAQFWGRKPSELYEDRDKLATLLRALRVTPFRLNEGAGGG